MYKKKEFTMSKSDDARKLFEKGYNCSQSVLGAFCEELGFDFETALKLSSSFGGGMGRMREVCGALTGAFMVAGLKKGYTSPENDKGKAEHYKLIQAIAQKFKEENGSILCYEILGLEKKGDSFVPAKRTDEYYEKRPCSECVASAAKIIEEFIK
jgi:C_GCAxxG_C_C family probable redox protein